MIGKNSKVTGQGKPLYGVLETMARKGKETLSKEREK